MHFEWNETKSRTNEKKHGVTFDEASTAFYDDNAILFNDPDHSGGEDRFLLLGVSVRVRVLVVVHCYRENDEVIRIISARKATSSEQVAYGSQGSRP